MKLTIITTAIAASMLLFSCNNATNENSRKATETTTQKTHDHDHESEAIVLNNGQKWKVDENMMIHIQNMKNDISKLNTEDEKSYAELAKKLGKNIELLTSDCTMEGQAHDELHKWLLPFIDLSEAFSASKAKEEYAIELAKIKTSFETFNTYFE